MLEMLPRIALSLIFATLTTACADLEPEVGAPDAGTVIDTAAACDPIPAPQREVECKAVCATADARCPGATGSACFAECAQFATGTAYCPVAAAALSCAAAGCTATGANRRLYPVCDAASCYCAVTGSPITCTP